MSYAAPVKSMQYLLRHAVNIDQLYGYESHSDLSDDLVGDILIGASEFAASVLAPTNWPGDQSGSRLEDDKVFTAPGFRQAYKDYVEAGWQGIAMSEEAGGMGLPQLVATATNESFYAANMAFGLCPMLTASAMKAIEAHASEALKRIYIPKMVTGEWSGAMNLTEPQAGSDLGPVRTKASDNGDGTYAISGQKIFITWGDHDCADNIVHLVLARLPDAPEGSKGISLFLCPKRFVNDDGSLGDMNKVKCIGLEHKLGIHGSPTCVMEFDGATGWLIGEPNRGLACMFTMMNEARLFVGVQGVAIGERAYQAALAYARERVQGRTIGEQDTIIGHPDMRRMLMDMKAKLMGARAICMATAIASDIAAGHSDEKSAKAAHARDALLTPIAKAYGSDIGVEVSSTGVQVHGGMGFVEETGAAQHYRDSRIAAIYEGTNGIQAIDLVGRKLRRDGGQAMAALMADLTDIHAAAKAAQAGLKGDDADLLESCTAALEQGLSSLSEATEIILSADEAGALSGATPYLRLCGEVIGGALLVKSVVGGLAANDPLAGNMLKLTHYHTLAIMGQSRNHVAFLRQSANAVMGFPERDLADL